MRVRRRGWYALALVSLAVVALVVVISSPSTGITCPTTARAGVSLNDLTEAERAAITALVSGNNEFAFDLYRALLQGDDNLIYSPLGISQAVAVVYAGARGETAQQIAAALHFRLAQEALDPAFRTVHSVVTPGTRESGDERPLELSIANALWGQAGFAFHHTYLDLINAYYQADLTPLDFVTMPEEARQRINDWGSAATNGRIQDLIAPGSLGPATRLVLTNAICFYGTWLREFDPAETRDEAFHLLDGSQVTVPMMGYEEAQTFRYAQGSGYQAVELPYEGGAAAMVVLMPDSGHFTAYERELDAGAFARVLATLSPHDMIVSLSFSTKSSMATPRATTELDGQNALGVEGRT